MSTAVPPPARAGDGPLRNLPVAQKPFLDFGVLSLPVTTVGATGLLQLNRSEPRPRKARPPLRTNLHGSPTTCRRNLLMFRY
jgi:hypothetical protein